jgi:hypothetical protein
MKRTTMLVVLAIGLVFFLTYFATQSFSEEKIIKMVGEISAIDSTHNTVVVEVSVGKTLQEEENFTVGGSLATEAELIKDGQPVKLEAFKVGERVVVKWTPTKTGHLILSLKSKPIE